ncbi:MAG: U32 family peptidase [Clostridia bacterium]|nr:U32 family peptidase [Clostridia bacterium]
MKILSPVGNFESIKMAVYYGADEVYLGVNNFNARNNIEGFTLDDLNEVVCFAHIHGVKVNLAVNILFRDDELEDAVNLVIDAFNMGVDCFIIQDLGLAHILHTNYPEIELHASTQLGLHNLEGVLNAKKFGFKRVVLARETPLEEIKRIKENAGIEIEYFAQGALCVCFSGNCYLSSYLLGASGNRGKCKQLCRLPYKLKNQGKTLAEGYLLSAKDFNMSAVLPKLNDAGVDVLKIEGRARRPFYVAMATMEYRKALDGKGADLQNLELAFNRGFTAGYFNGNGNIISHYNNHIGIHIGEVVNVKKGKKFDEITFTSTRPLNAKSSIKIFDGEKEISTIALFDLKQNADRTYLVTTTQPAKKGNSVNLIIYADLENEILTFERKKDIKISIEAFAGEKIVAKTDFYGVTLVGDELEKAKSQALTTDELQANFERNEYFSPAIELKTDGVFMPKSKLNEFRRSFYSAILDAVKNAHKHSLAHLNICTDLSYQTFVDFQIFDENPGLTPAKNVVYSPEIYDENEIVRLKEMCKCFGKKLYLDLPNFALEADVAYLKKLVEKNNIPVIVNNMYALGFECEKVIGGGMNVFNKYTAHLLGLPVMCSEDCFINKTAFPYMTLRHCPMKNDLNANCGHCPYNKDYYFEMQNGKVLKLKRKKLSTCTFYLTD